MKTPMAPEASSRFLPFRLQPEDPGQVSSFRRLVAGMPTDSTRHWSLVRGKLRITHDMLRDLSEGTAPAQAPLRPEGFADFLRKRHGLRLRPSLPAFGRYVPNDSMFPVGPQWGLINNGVPVGMPARAGVDVNVRGVWDRFSGHDTLVIAVVDAGFNFAHPDMAGRRWLNKKEAAGKPGFDDDGNGFLDDTTGWDFVDDDNGPADFNGHGTVVSSVIAANFDNGKGVAGVLAKGRIMPVRVLDASGHGDQNDIAAGILYAINNGAHVINFSIGGGGDNSAMRSAFQAARDKGVPIVAAAGNYSKDLDVSPTYPSAYDFDNVLIVASHNPEGGLSPFSNYGAAAAHLAAPGEKILVCGVPERKDVWREGFEGTLGSWSVTGMAVTAAEPLAGKQSLTWTTGNNAQAATANWIDLRGKRGASLRMQIAYQPASFSDALIAEGNKEGTSQWHEIAVFAMPLSKDAPVTFGLQEFDGTRFKLRLRLSLSSMNSAATRSLKIDDVAVTYPDPKPVNEEVYVVRDGTSMSAPFVAAYVGLQRLACDRMGIKWTRALALEGVTPEPALKGKVLTGGRLDMAKGLDFYLRTLPALDVDDSGAVAWRVGDSARYTISVPKAYRLSVDGLGADARLDTAIGRVTWIPSRPGEYLLTLRADGEATLRRRLILTVIDGHPVAARFGTEGGTGGSLARLGRQAFHLPSAAGTQFLEISGADALGRSKILKRGWVGSDGVAAAFREAAAAAPLAHFQVLWNGRRLPAAR